MAGKRKRSQKSTEGVAPVESKCKLSSAHSTVGTDSHDFEDFHLETKRASAIKDSYYRPSSPKSQQQLCVNTAARFTVTDHHRIHSYPVISTTDALPSSSRSPPLQSTSTSLSPPVRCKRRRLNSLSYSDGAKQQTASSNSLSIDQVKTQLGSVSKYSVIQQQPDSSATERPLEIPKIKNKTRCPSYSHSKHFKCDNEIPYLRSVHPRARDSTVDKNTKNVHSSFTGIDSRSRNKKHCEHRTKSSVPQFSAGLSSIDHGVAPRCLTTASDMPVGDTDGNPESANSRPHSQSLPAPCSSHVPLVPSFGSPECRDQLDPRLVNHDVASWRPPPRVFVIPDFPSLATSNRFPRSLEVDGINQASDVDPSLLHGLQISGSNPLDLTTGISHSSTNKQCTSRTGIVHPNSLDDITDDRYSTNKSAHRGTPLSPIEAGPFQQAPALGFNPAMIGGSPNASAFVVTPLATGITYPGPTPSVQQLLNPTSMARLIALGTAAATGRSDVPSPPPSSNLVNDPVSCSTTSAVINRPPLRIPSSQPHPTAPSKTGTQIDLAQWRATVAPWWARSAAASGSSGSGPSHHPMGRHSPHSTSVNQRIAQLQQSHLDRSMQLIILQDINQILLIGYEETLFHLNVEGLVNCILDILSSDDELQEMSELKNLSCTVLTHMMDALPHSSSAVVPALPLLLSTMSCSFVGDILERIINLMEQLSRRHGRDVLQSGGIASIMSFYDFVTLAQHRTILTMIANCFSELRSSDADFDLIADCLPSLSERLRESEPRCVECVCTCFLRLVNAYRSNSHLLKRIVTSCNLFSNLQHLLVASPPILSAYSVRDVIHMLSMMCSSCPDLTVDLIKQGIAGTLYTTIVGRSVNLNELRERLISPIADISLDGYEASVHPRRRSKRTCSQTRGSAQPKRSTSRKRQLCGDASTVDQLTNTGIPSPTWQPLMLLTPFPQHADNRSAELYDLAVTQRSPQNVHVIVQLICELLPPVPSAYTTLLICEPQQSSDSRLSVSSVNSPDTLESPSSILLDTVDVNRSLTDSATHSVPQSPINKGSTIIPPGSERRRCRSGTGSGSQRLSTSSSTCSSTSSSTLSATLGFINCSLSGLHSESGSDPRAQLLHRECEQLHSLLESTVEQPISSPDDQTKQNARRRSPKDKPVTTETTARNSKVPSSDHDEGDFEAVQLVQILLPLLFELLSETTRSQTRLRCLEAIQRMVFHSSPILLAKVLHPRIVCSHIVGMLSSPEQCVVLSELQIALMLLDRVPLMFATYFRKEGILHLVNQLLSDFNGASSSTDLIRQRQPVFNWTQLLDTNSSHIDRTCPGSGTLAEEQQLAEDVRRSTARSVSTNSRDNAIPSIATPLCSSRPCNPYPWAVPNSSGSKTAVSIQDTSPSCNPPLFIASSDSLSLLASAVLSPKHTSDHRWEDKLPQTPLNASHSLEQCSLKPGNAMSFWIHRACLQIQSRIADLTMADHPRHLVTSSDQMDSLHPIADQVPADRDGNKLPYSIDLMPKLEMIVTHLQSSQPALWLFSLTHLIKLLLPSTKLHTEPPSPFELHHSGLTMALLNFLTTPDSHCLRLWMFCRLFFSSRCKNSDVRFLPLASAPNVSHKKQSSNSKNPIHFYCLSPIGLTETQAKQLKEFDLFIDSHLPDLQDTSSDDPCSIQAFSTLLGCLLAYFHRHEHFQVRGLPSLLPPSSPFLNLLNQSHTRHISEDAPKKSDTSDLPSDNPPTSPTSSQTSTRTSHRSSTFRILGRSTRNHHPSPTTVNEPLKVCSASSDVTDVPPSYALPASRTLHPLMENTVTPTAGVLWLNLQRISDEYDCHSGEFASGGSTRNNRKSTSSSSSVSSNYSSSSTLSAEGNIAIPINFTLPITALATFQHLERLLLQRNYISSVLSDGGLSHDHDYLSPLISYPNATRIALVDDLERLIGANRNGLSLMTGSDGLDQMSSLRSVLPGKSKLPGFDASFPNSFMNTFDESSSPNQEELGELANRTELLLSNIQQLHSSNLQEMQQPSTRSVPSTQGALQRGLRSLLQRGTDVLPNMTKGSADKTDTASASMTQTEPTLMPVASVPSAVRVVRRKSTTNLNINMSSCGAVNESILDSSKTPPKSRANPSSSSYSLRHSSSNNPSSTATTSDEIVPQSTTSGSVSKTRTTLAAQVSHKPDNIAAGNRHRRLKGSSILAAFGALSNLSSNVVSSSSGTSHYRGTSGSSGSVAQPSSSSHRQANIKSSPSTSSSTSNSSLSPLGTDNSAARVKHRLSVIFYIGNHQIPLHMPLYQALRKFSSDVSRQINSIIESVHESSSAANRTSVVQTLGESGKDDMVGHLMWNMLHTIRYRFVRTSCVKESHNRTPTGSKKSDVRGSHGGLHLFGHRHGIHAAGKVTDHQQQSISSEQHSSLSVSMNCIKRRRSDETPLTQSTSVTSPLYSTSSVDARLAWLPETGNASGSVCHPLISELLPYLPLRFTGDFSRRMPSEQTGGLPLPSQNTLSLNQANSPNVCDFSNCVDSTGLANNTLDSTTSNTLSLLRILHRVSRLWYTVRDMLDPHPAISSVVFRSPKLTVKARRQLQDMFSVLAGNLPQWLVQLISTCPFLFPFEIRRTFFFSYNFDRDRTLLRFQKNGSSLSDMHQGPGPGRQTVNNSSTVGSSASTFHGDYYFTGLSPSPTVNNSSVVVDTSTPAIVSTGVNPNCEFLSGILQELEAGQSGSSHLTGSISGHHGHNHQPHRHLAHPRTHRVRHHTRLAMTPNIRRHKMTVIRDGKQLLRQAESTFTEMLDSRAMLEIAFEGEVGFGLGPTLEFYTLVSRQLMQASLHLWYGNEVTKDGHTVALSPGLYPRPLAKQGRSSVTREIRNKFLFVGRLLARSLLDWRQLDLPLSPAFFKWFLAPTAAAAISSGRILPNDLSLIDPDLSRQINHLAKLANRRQNLLAQLEVRSEPTFVQTAGNQYNKCASSQAPIVSAKSPADLEQLYKKLKDSLIVMDNEIEQLCLTFVIPGYEIELVKNGSHISVCGSNIGDYIRLVSHWIVIEGVRLQMEAVLDGFDSVLPGVRQHLALLFEPHEMEGLFCGLSAQSSGVWLEEAGMTKLSGGSFTKGRSMDSEFWEVQTLTETCQCDHGYTVQSRTIRNLFEVMSELNDEQRRLFVQFVTGSPRLPVGGFRALKPPLTIVMKREHGDNADSHLPSVMTCQNYLKLPDYSTKELLREKLLYAIREGQNAFHLS